MLALWLLSCVSGLPGAESNTLRLAVGPFFAPVGNDSLHQASQVLPELVVAELSRLPRYQLVEREKVQAVWNEMNLGASGLVERDTVARLGRVLACDWLVSGAFVQAGGRTHVWTKVIDVRTGVVLDLNAAPYEPGAFTNTVAGIAAFLARAGAEPKGRQFIAMGPFVDMNPPFGAPREDWSRRIAALIEKHFLEAGFGVVEMAAVGPIFEERRLEAAGLTGQPDGRVKLQPAFWLVDGGCEWVETAPGQLSVGLRIQKVGGPAQMFRLTEAAGEEMEQAVIATLVRAFTNTNLVAQPTPNAEADLLAARGMELASLRSPFRPNISTGAPLRTQYDSYKRYQEDDKRRLENRNATIATFERTLLRDPKNLEAKSMLGRALLSDPEPARRERGRELLGEIMDLKDPKNAAYIQMIADNIKRREARRRPDDWESLNQILAENPNDLEAKCSMGAALLSLPRASDRERGTKMLAEVVAGDRPDQAERARRLLAEPEKHPAFPDVATATVAARPSANSIPVAALEPEDDFERGRREFFQKQFSKFVPVQFGMDGPRLAKMQRVSVRVNRFDYQGQHYCGIRFTTPAWTDGGLKWMHILAKTEAQKDFGTTTFQWDIISKSGRMQGFETYYNLDVGSYEQLKRQFPHTHTAIMQSLPKEYLKPGQEYAIWFGFKEDDLPDIAFALTIESSNGYFVLGALPIE